MRRLPLVAAAALILTLSGCAGDNAGDNGDNTANDKPDTTVETTVETTTAAAATGVTYEITGTTPAPLTVSYAGSDGENVELTVSDLPWSVTVDPAPDLVSIFALSTSIEAPDPDIALTLKRGTEVLRTCQGGAPCLTGFPA